MTEVKAHEAKPRKRFVWFSAISFGALFSAVSFGFGFGDLDQTLLKLNLRTAIDSQAIETYRFGDREITFQATGVENLPAEGVRFRHVRRPLGQPDARIEVHEDRFAHPQGVPIKSGGYLQSFLSRSSLWQEPAVLSCVLLDSYHWLIPVYRYSVAVQYPPVAEYPVTPPIRARMNFKAAEEIARSAGWTGAPAPVSVVHAPVEFIDNGWTLSRTYCDNLKIGAASAGAKGQ